MAIALLALLASVAVMGYCKLILLNRYHFEEYLSSPPARRLYWSARLSAGTLALSIAAVGYLTGLAMFAIPLYVFAAFTMYVNARATYMRLSGRYRTFYRERGLT